LRHREGKVPRRSVSIRLHLAIYGALIVLPLLAAGLLIAKLYVDQTRESLTAQAHQIVSDATGAIDQELNRYRLALQVLSASNNLAEGKFEQLYLRAQALSESIADSAIALRRASDGETIFFTTQPYGEPVPKQLDPELRAADKLAVEHRSPVITDLVAGAFRPTVVALEAPVVANNRADFLLTLTISPKGVLDILNAHQRASGWLLAVTDNNDRTIARSWDNERFSGQKAPEDFIRHTQEKAGSFIGTTLEGVRAFTVYKRSELSGWRISAGIPLSDLEAPLYRSMIVLAIVAGIGLLGSLILAFFYARVLSRPLRQLQGVAESGDEGGETIPTGIAELDGVTGTLMRAMVVLKDRDRARARTFRELNHRMKNMLAIILAIANETRRRATSLEQFGKAFEGRLMALSKSHEALGDPEWHGGDLAALIKQCCKPFCDEAKLDLQGPPVELPPKATIGIGMVLHELATNAAKYGALSIPGGNVKVHWDVPDEGGLRVLRLQWQERNGPPMPESRKEGFGTVLLRSIVESDLGGRLDMTFARDGLHCIICIPMTALLGPSIVPQEDETETAGMPRR
jgi:two-component sensor histidine kinase